MIETKLNKDVTESIQAGFSGMWVRSYEHDEAVRELQQMCDSTEWLLYYWDVAKGFVNPADVEPEMVGSPGGIQTLVQAIKALDNFSEYDSNVILVIPNLHLYIDSKRPMELQTLQNALVDGAARRQHFVGIVPQTATIPVEIEKQMRVLDHDLPLADELWDIAESIIDEENENCDDPKLLVVKPEGDQKRMILNAAAGFTRLEFANAVSLSIIRHNGLLPDEMWEMKSQALKKSGLLEMVRPTQGFATLGGMDVLKKHTLQFFNSPHAEEDDVQARGIVLLGPPGSGKTEFVNRLGFEAKRPVLVFEIGKLMGSLVGQTEERTRQVFKLADAMAPCILFVDELEKAMAGMGSGNDSGVGGRLLGTMLTWLNDHKTDVFFVGTANDAESLPDAFTRAERFDGIYFADFPNEAGREAIWDVYRKKFNISEDDQKPDDTNWTGAEIKACCRLARLRDIPLQEVAPSIVPVIRVNREGVDKMRNWAKDRCLSADYEGSFRADPLDGKIKSTKKATRKLSKKA